LAAFLDWWRRAPSEELRAAYVGAFDLAAATTLHLTYHVWGDARERGAALADLNRRFRAAGLRLAAWELPDHLPLLLEFAAAHPPAGVPILQEYRAPIATVEGRLREAGHPYAPLLTAIVAAIPPPAGLLLGRAPEGGD
jgi:nitrate reductase delta subunit